ncbi:MAG: hypothetical protein ACRDTV_06325 [Mycobacterium sp.]
MSGRPSHRLLVLLSLVILTQWVGHADDTNSGAPAVVEDRGRRRVN